MRADRKRTIREQSLDTLEHWSLRRHCAPSPLAVIKERTPHGIPAHNYANEGPYNLWMDEA